MQGRGLTQGQVLPDVAALEAFLLELHAQRVVLGHGVLRATAHLHRRRFCSRWGALCMRSRGDRRAHLPKGIGAHKEVGAGAGDEADAVRTRLHVPADGRCQRKEETSPALFVSRGAGLTPRSGCCCG